MRGEMMSTITITVCDQKKTFSYDLEVPVMQAMDTLSTDIVEVLEGCHVTLNKTNVQFFVPRLKRILNNYETLGQAGVYNGDYLIIY